MRYFHSPHRETTESNYLQHNFGKAFFPAGPVSLDRATRIATPGVLYDTVAGNTLAVHAETASWTFLTAGEEEFLLEADRCTVGSLLDRYPADRHVALAAFMQRLFRRGIITLNGKAAMDNALFEDSPNTMQDHLVELLLTEKCNLNCAYCLAGANPNMPTMTEEIATTVIDKAFLMHEAGTITFEFSGGEPFLQYPLMQHLVRYIHSHPGGRGRSVYICAQTNATLLNRKRVAWLKENDVRIGVSIDGNPETHNVSRPTVTGRESFTKVIRGLKLLQEFEIPFGALVVLNSSNVKSVDALVTFLQEYGLASLRLNPIAFLGTARGNWDSFGLTNEDVVGYFKSFMSTIVNRELLILEDNTRTMIEYLLSKQRNSRCMRTHCGAGENFQAISANGDIYPCGRSTQSPALKIGNVLESVGSLSEIGLRSEAVRTIKRIRPRDYDDCRTCHYQQLCQSGCPVQSFEKYGTLRHKTPECSFYKAMYPFLMDWLSSDQRAVEHLSAASYFPAPVKQFNTTYL